MSAYEATSWLYLWFVFCGGTDAEIKAAARLLHEVKDT